MSRSSGPERVPVAIVGAGPVGLSLALGLARLGVRSVLIERNAATSAHSKAPGIHVRTREAFQQWGIAQRFLDAGVLKQTLRVHPVARGGGPLLTLDFSELQEEADRPGLLILEQGKTEELLLDAVRESGRCDVRFSTEAVRLVQDADGVTLAVRRSGQEQEIASRFLVGCDGASSFVREALGLGFDGITYSILPLLADVRISDERDRLPWPRIHNGRGGLTAAVRLQDRLWRLICIKSGKGKGEEVPQEEVAGHVDEVLGRGPFELVWGSRFRIHRRSSPRYRVGRVLLAGDAAHVHSPVGGQGMNAGIQSAHNLAWKLARAHRGGDLDRLLDSYEVERREIVEGSIFPFTDLLTRGLLLAPPLVRAPLFPLLRMGQRIPRLRRRMLRRMTMINLDYRDSPLLDPRERSAGVRLPNPLLQAPDGAGVRLYDLLPNGPVILDVAERRPFASDLPVEHVIRIGPGGHRDDTGLLRRLLGDTDGWILVRPDAHVAWARDRLDGMGEAVQRSVASPVPDGQERLPDRPGME